MLNKKTRFKLKNRTTPVLKVSGSVKVFGNILLSVIIIAIIMPIILTLLYSFLPSGVIPNIKSFGDIAGNFTWDGYKDVFHQLPFLHIAKNSVFIAFISTALQLTVALTTAFALTHWDYPGKDYLFGLIIIAMIIPYVSLMIPNYMTVSSLGMVKKFSGVIVPGIANAYGIFLMRQFFEKVPRSLIEACRIDGGNDLHILLHVYLPLSLPAITSLMIILMVANWNDYQWPLLILQEAENMTLPLALVRFRNEGLIDWMPTAAACIMTIIPIMLIYLFVQRQIVDTFASTATKE